MATITFCCVTHLCVLNFIEQNITTKCTKEENTKATEISPCPLCKTLWSLWLKKIATIRAPVRRNVDRFKKMLLIKELDLFFSFQTFIS
jgi:hypothetical protein